MHWGTTNGRARARAALLTLIAVAVLAACGGGGDAATTTTADEGTTLDEPDTETTVPTETDTDQPDDASGDDDLPAFTSVCVDASQAVAAAVTSYSSGFTEAMGGTLDDSELEEVTDQLQAMAAAAPDEIQADLEVMAAEIGTFYEAWAEIGYTGEAAPTPEQIEQLEALSDSIDQAAYTEAIENLEAWFDANC